MVSNQRDNQEGYHYMTGQVLHAQNSHVKKNIQKVTSKRSRVAPAFLKEQVEVMLEVQEMQKIFGRERGLKKH